MKKIILILSLSIIFSISANAQVYRNCKAIINAFTTDSVAVKGQSNEAWVELNTQTGEINLKVKLGTFKGDNAIINQHLSEHNERLYFKGNLGIEIQQVLSDLNKGQLHQITGYIKLNGIKHPTIAGYSIFRIDNSTSYNKKPLLSLNIDLNLNDYQLAQYFPELIGQVQISLVGQQINFVAN